MGSYAFKSLWEKLNHQKYKQMLLRKTQFSLCWFDRNICRMAKYFLVEIPHLQIVLQKGFSIIIQDKSIVLWRFVSLVILSAKILKHLIQTFTATLFTFLHTCIHGFHFYKTVRCARNSNHGLLFFLQLLPQYSECRRYSVHV